MIGRLRDAAGWLQLRLDLFTRLEALEHENAELLGRIMGLERAVAGAALAGGVGECAVEFLGRVAEIEKDIENLEAIAAELYTGPAPAKARKG